MSSGVVPRFFIVGVIVGVMSLVFGWVLITSYRDGHRNDLTTQARRLPVAAFCASCESEPDTLGWDELEWVASQPRTPTSAQGLKASDPGKCCWNRGIQSCKQDWECEAHGEGCVARGTMTAEYGAAKCNLCELDGRELDRPSWSCQTDDVPRLWQIYRALCADAEPEVATKFCSGTPQSASSEIHVEQLARCALGDTEQCPRNVRAAMLREWKQSSTIVLEINQPLCMRMDREVKLPNGGVDIAFCLRTAEQRFTDDVSRVSCPIVDGSAASWSATPGVMLAVPWANSFQHGFLDLLPRLHSMIKVVPPSLRRHMSVIAEENLWTQLAVARSNTGMELHIHIFVD